MRTIFFCLLFLLNLTSCLKDGEFKAKDPIWNKQGCDRCRMILSEKRYAVQKVFETGHTLYYDDLNCALLHPLPEQYSDKSYQTFVLPYPSQDWVLAETVRYQKGLMTPMGSGIGAVVEGGDLSFEDAKALILRQGHHHE